jgi:hypothetical protein
MTSAEFVSLKWFLSTLNHAHCFVSAVCEDILHGLKTLTEVLNDSRTKALIGSMDPLLCETVAGLANRRVKLFITWSCQQVKKNYLQ